MKEPSAKDFIHLGGAAMQPKETCLKISIMSYLFTKPTSISFTVVGSLNCLCISSSALKYYISVLDLKSFISWLGFRIIVCPLLL